MHQSGTIVFHPFGLRLGMKWQRKWQVQESSCSPASIDKPERAFLLGKRRETPLPGSPGTDFRSK